MLALLPMLTSAYDAEIDGIYYNFSGDEAIVTYQREGYVGSNWRFISDYSGAIVIPESVIYSNKTYSVTSIDEFAFENCTELTSVTIPGSVTRYSPDGKKLSKPQKGLNILRYLDGTSKKLFVK